MSSSSDDPKQAVSEELEKLIDDARDEIWDAVIDGYYSTGHSWEPGEPTATLRKLAAAVRAEALTTEGQTCDNCGDTGVVWCADCRAQERKESHEEGREQGRREGYQLATADGKEALADCMKDASVAYEKGRKEGEVAGLRRATRMAFQGPITCAYDMKKEEGW